MIDVEALVANKPRSFMLTTLDNPYNPYHDFNRWYAWDEAAGYRTSEYIARVCWNSDELTEEDEDTALMLAMEEILDVNVTNNYVKIYEDTITERRIGDDMF